jgi:hypothetical protein
MTETMPDRYHRLGARLPDVLDRLEAHVDPRFVRDDWAERNRELAGHLLPVPPADLLRHPHIAYQMFVDAKYVPAELPYVESRLPDRALLTEDPVGEPPTTVLDDGVVTSSNTVHHLHHLLRYEQATGRRLADLPTVVEWGAGYGSLARLLLRLVAATDPAASPTYVALDTPVYSAVQWLYLSSVLGEDRVVLHDQPGLPVEAGRVNVVPIGLVAELQVTADLFVSTWALNESTPEAQDHVVGRDWFGAEALLLAMHEGDPLEAAVLGAGATPVPLGSFMPHQRYLVR